METFVYGTLADRDGAAALLDAFEFAGPAVLVGLHRVDGRYPTLAPGGRVRGRVLVTDEVATLDAYEGTERGLYVRVPVPVEGGRNGGGGCHNGGGESEDGRGGDEAGGGGEGGTGGDDGERGGGGEDGGDGDGGEDGGDGYGGGHDAGGGTEPTAGTDALQLYVGDPDRLDADVEWPGDGPFARRVERYVETAHVVVRREGDR